MEKIDFSFFITQFSPKNEKFAKNENFRFSLETIVGIQNRYSSKKVDIQNLGAGMDSFFKKIFLSYLMTF